MVAPARAIFGVCETVTLLSADEDPAEAVIVPVPDNAANDALTSVAVHVPAPDVMHTGASWYTPRHGVSVAVKKNDTG